MTASHRYASGFPSDLPADHPFLPRAPATTPRIDSAKLLAAGKELVIEHAGAEYRLRLTRNDKLILTK